MSSEEKEQKLVEMTLVMFEETAREAFIKKYGSTPEQSPDAYESYRLKLMLKLTDKLNNDMKDTETP